MVTESPARPRTRRIVKYVDMVALFAVRHWLGIFLVLYGAWVIMPFMAPILMQIGATTPAQGVYFFYSFFCHQLPERSIFFFGPQRMYSLEQIGQFWSTDNPLILRQFIGNTEMGWKMAWSDRMISTYGGIWLAGLLYWLLGKRAPRLPLWAWLVFGVLPLGLDGFSHFINDIVAGTSGAGFRDTNAWLQALTFNSLPATFYAGDEFGSFNSWSRWVTGLLFGFTTVFAVFPIIAESMRATAYDLQAQLDRIRASEHVQ